MPYQENIPGTERPPDFREIIRRFIKINGEIILSNEEKFRSNNSRFLFAFSETPDHKQDGFIKIAKIDDRNMHQQLRRESETMNVAVKLGIPTIKQYDEYAEFPEGYAAVHYEKLDSENGDLLSSAELIASAPPEYGEWEAKALLKTSGVEIPSDIDTAIFKKDGRNASPETFWRVWKESEDKVLNIPEEKQKILDPQQIKDIQDVINELKPILEALIKDANEENKYFFAHNDAAPDNTFFDTKTNKAILLDFEHSGVTRNRILAQLTDFGNFYAKSWPNPEMQSSFISTLMEQSARSIHESYIISKATILFGTLYLAKYAMDPNNKDHLMAKLILKSLPNQLKNLEETYITLVPNTTHK